MDADAEAEVVDARSEEGETERGRDTAVGCKDVAGKSLVGAAEGLEGLSLMRREPGLVWVGEGREGLHAGRGAGGDSTT